MIASVRPSLYMSNADRVANGLALRACILEIAAEMAGAGGPVVLRDIGRRMGVSEGVITYHVKILRERGEWPYAVNVARQSCRKGDCPDEDEVYRRAAEIRETRWKPDDPRWMAGIKPVGGVTRVRDLSRFQREPEPC